jgi:hypothetical protein
LHRGISLPGCGIGSWEKGKIEYYDARESFFGVDRYFFIKIKNAADGMNVRKDKNYFSCITGLTMQRNYFCVYECVLSSHQSFVHKNYK